MCPAAEAAEPHCRPQSCRYDTTASNWGDAAIQLCGSSRSTAHCSAHLTVNVRQRFIWYLTQNSRVAWTSVRDSDRIYRKAWKISSPVALFQRSFCGGPSQIYEGRTESHEQQFFVK